MPARKVNRKATAKPRRELNPRQALFVSEYLLDLNATQAAIRAGYSEKTARQIGMRLLTNVDIAHAIQVGMDKRTARTEITADRVLRELATIGFSDIAHYAVNDNGKIELVEDAPDTAMRAISSVKHRVRVDEDGNTTHETEYRLWDKNTALSNLGRHLKLFTDRIEHDVTDKLAERLQAARERAKLTEQ